MKKKPNPLPHVLADLDGITISYGKNKVSFVPWSEVEMPQITESFAGKDLTNDQIYQRVLNKTALMILEKKKVYNKKR